MAKPIGGEAGSHGSNSVDNPATTFSKNNVAQRKDKYTMADTELMLDVGQANELKLAFRRAGYTNAEIKKLSEGDLLVDLLPLIRSYGQPTTFAVPRHIIDCDADPFVRSGFKVESHQKGGQLVFDAKKIELYLSETQKSGKGIKGNKLLKELANKPVLNACVLNYLLANPHLIPEEWKGKAVFFFGTVYRNSHGSLYVRYLYWSGERWDSRYFWLGNDCGNSILVAVLAS